MKKIDLTGKRFGRLNVLRETGQRKCHEILWQCLCDCGKAVLVSGAHLRGGRTRSCGCLQKEIVSNGTWKTTHGQSYSRLYRVWDGMVRRCKNLGIKNYGGRGIKVCKRWLKFESFMQDVGQPPTAKHTIERIDNNGNYEPGNVRWATPLEQGRNKRNSKFLTYLGKTLCFSEWAREVGLSTAIIGQRFRKGWPVELILSKEKHWRNQYTGAMT